MTLSELNTYFELVSRLEKAEEMLENLEAAAGPHSPALTGMPRSTVPRDKIADFAIEIADIKARIDYYHKEIEKHRAAVDNFISGISDMYLRTIFRLRFMRGCSWKTVAYVLGGGNSEDGVKSACYRYLKKLQRADTP